MKNTTACNSAIHSHQTRKLIHKKNWRDDKGQKFIFSVFLWFIYIFPLTQSTWANNTLQPLPAKAKTLLVRKVSGSNEWQGNRFVDITQDPQGFIWVATDKALHRYDGHDIKTYLHHPGESNGLPHGDLLNIIADNYGYIWISSMYGISRLHTDTDTFETMAEFTVQRNPHFTVDSAGNIWYINDSSIYYYHQLDSKLHRIHIDDKLKEHNYDNVGIANFVLMDDNKLLFRTNQGSLIYDIQNNQINNIKHDDLTKVIAGNVFMRTSQGYLFLRSKENILYQFDVSRNSIRPLIQLPQEHISSRALMDRNNNVWASNYGSLFFANQNKGVTYAIDRMRTKNEVIASFGIEALFEDRQGQIWIAERVTRTIYIYNPEVEVFALNEDGHANELGFSENTVSTLYQDNQRNIWVGYDGGELKQLDASSNTLKDVRFIDEKVYYYRIVETKDGRLWIATSKGLYQTQLKDAEFNFSKIYPKPMDNVKANVSVTALASDNEGHLWFGTNARGLFRLNTKNDSIEHKVYNLKAGHGIAANDYIDYLHYDTKKRLWIISPYGLYLINDTESSDLTAYYHNTNDSTTICDRYVNSVFDTAHGDIWITTRSGIGRYSEHRKNFTCFRENNGLPSNIVQTALTSNTSDDLWIGTSKGLAKVDLNGTVLETYHNSAGLFANLALGAGLIDEQQGIMWLGTHKGLNRVRISELVPKQNNSRIVITDVQVQDPDELPETNPSKLQQLTLSYNNNSLQLSYANLDYSPMRQSHYRVKLENWDHDWLDTGANTTVRYANLAPGNYQFKVAVADTTQHQKAHTLSITVTPPLWQTPIAYVIYWVLLFVIIIAFVKFRTRHLEHRARHLERLVQSRIQKTVEQKQTIELLLKKNLELFANVSHEFRTPLTLIIGPASKILKESKNSSIKKDLRTIVTNGNRMLRMVDQLLDISRLDNKSSSETTWVDISAVTRTVLAHFDSLLKEQKLTLDTHIEPKIRMKIQQDAYEKILTNLLTNAIKFSPAGTVINVTCRNFDSSVVLSVRDQGIGIAPEYHNKIFERFVRVQQENHNMASGAGIGLALVKQLVEYHGGHIVIESESGHGACFQVTFSGQQSGEKLTDACPVTEHLHHHSPTSKALDRELELLRYTNHTTYNDHSGAECTSSNNTMGKPVLLIVEDNKDMQQFIQQSLMTHFFCLLANDGQHGMMLALKEIPDIIITDLMMPKKNGFEFTKVIRDDINTSHIPVLVLTAKADLDTRKFAWQLYVDEFIEKPFNADELLLRCKNLLHIRTLLNERLRLDIGNSYRHDRFAIINERDQDFLEQLERCVEQHYANRSLNVTFICQQLAMSERQLQRKIKALLGQNMSEFIRHHRLNRAATKLKTGEKLVNVAFSVGFSSQSYFGRCFKEHYGVTPRQYIETGHKNGPSSSLYEH